MTKRDRTMLLVVVAVAVLGGFWMLLLSPQRKAAAEARAQVDTAQAALDAARTKVESGRRAENEFRRDRTAIVKLGRVVPETDDIPTLLTQLGTLAKRDGVKFYSYEVATDTGTPSTTDPGATSSSSTTTASKSDDKVSSSTQATAPLFPPGSVQIDGGLGRTPLTLKFRGTYFMLERYLRAVQRFAVLSQKSTRTNGRLLIVDGFSYELGEGKTEFAKKYQEWARQPILNATLSASVYFAPPLDAPSAGSTGSGSASSSGAAPALSAGGSSTGTAVVGGVQ